MSKLHNKYDLEERTVKFGESDILFCKTLKQDVISKPLINQIVISATSIGANYMEASGTSSKRDFKNKIHICKKESQETKQWLRMLEIYFPNNNSQIDKLWTESQEFTLIFSKITSTLKGQNEN